MKSTADQLIDQIEERVRKTIAPTFSVRGETLEGRISAVDFDTIIKLYRAARVAAMQEQERCASLHESINPGCDCQPEGCGAMGAIIKYRDLIRRSA